MESSPGIEGGRGLVEYLKSVNIDCRRGLTNVVCCGKRSRIVVDAVRLPPRSGTIVVNLGQHAVRRRIDDIERGLASVLISVAKVEPGIGIGRGAARPRADERTVLELHPLHLRFDLGVPAAGDAGIDVLRAGGLDVAHELVGYFGKCQARNRSRENGNTFRTHDLILSFQVYGIYCIILGQRISIGSCA